MQEIIDLQQQVYEANKAKGFWDDAENRNKIEAVALINSEFYEALEGHRKGRDAISIILGSKITLDHTNNLLDPAFKEFMDTMIKDSWQDEMADSVIRILDYTGGFGIKLFIDTTPALIPDNFAENVFDLNLGVNETFRTNNPSGWSYIIKHIVDLCEKRNVDLYQHIIWKLRYNTLREHKHGKKY